jgi:hypothetical protein
MFVQDYTIRPLYMQTHNAQDYNIKPLYMQPHNAESI